MDTSKEWMRITEAREWMKRYRKKVMEEGKQEAAGWWQMTLSDIAKKRGRAAADQLRQDMNHETRKKS
jgi:hypothetical protein